MLSSRIMPRLIAGGIRIPKSAWATAMAKISDPAGLWYMREFQLSSIQAPQVLAISRGFPEAEQPGQPVEPVEPTPVEPSPVEPAPQPPAQTIFDVITARGSINEDTKVAVAELKQIINDNAELFEKLFSVLDNAYDRLFWRAMLRIQDHSAFIKRLIEGVASGTPAFEIVGSIGTALGLDRLEVSRWKALAQATGEIA
jgi:hypothetical protein